MEKISNIVRGSSRVGSVDLKNAAPVRPGAPSFGRPLGTSTRIDRDGTTTAQRAVNLFNDRNEQKKLDREAMTVQSMANSFFTNRLAEAPEGAEPAPVAPGTEVPREMVAAPVEGEALEVPAVVAEQKEAPAEYTPRGSYLDINA